MKKPLNSCCILAVFLLNPCRIFAQPSLDFNEILSFTRIGVFHADEGKKWAMAYVPVISALGFSSKAEYFNLNVGMTNDLSDGEKRFLFLAGIRIDSVLAKLARTSFAQKYLAFAAVPPLEIAPGIMTSNFKRYQWGIGIAYKFK